MTTQIMFPYMQILNLKTEIKFYKEKLEQTIYAGPDTKLFRYIGEDRKYIEDQLAKAEMKLLLLGGTT